MTQKTSIFAKFDTKHSTMDSEKQFKDQSNNLIKTGQNIEENSSESLQENSNVPEKSFSEFKSQFNFPPRAERLLKDNVSHQALENIKQIFSKTESIKKVADKKHQEIHSQFKELRDRLSHSSECLQRMQKGISNLKCSYQSKIYEMQRTLEPGDCFNPEKNPLQTKEDMAKHMEQIRGKIEKIQTNVYSEKEKQQRVMQGYKEAFENVSSLLESIDKGSYSSMKVDDVKKTM